MAADHVVNNTGQSWSMGLGGEFQSVPTGYQQQFIMSLASTGINGAMTQWGQALRR